MLRKKLNLKTIFYLLNIFAFIIYYLSIDIHILDVMYLFFVLLYIVKYIFIEVR